MALAGQPVLADAPMTTDGVRCATHAQIDELIHYSMPVLIESTVNRCGPLLPDGAYLHRSGSTLIARYRNAERIDIHSVMRTLSMFDKEGKPLPKMDDDDMRSIVDHVISGMIKAQLNPGVCQTVNRLAETLDPLPRPNTERLVEMLLEVGAKKDPSFRICPDPVVAAR